MSTGDVYGPQPRKCLALCLQFLLCKMAVWVVRTERTDAGQALSMLLHILRAQHCGCIQTMTTAKDFLELAGPRQDVQDPDGHKSWGWGGGRDTSEG